MLHKLILASKSPQRSELLKKHGVEFTVVYQDAREDDVFGAPAEVVAELAARKARAVADGISKGFVLGADTLVAIDGQSLGKPEDEKDALRMLALLSGRTHEVLTGLCVVDAETGEERRRVVKTHVTFRALTGGEIADYVKTGDPMTRAGAYGIQGKAGGFVESIEGSYENVVGLPVNETIELISTFSASSKLEE